MNLDAVTCQLSDRWFNIFQSRFLILPCSETLREAIKSKSVNGSCELSDLCEALVEHSLKDWSKVYDTMGLEVPYTKVAAVTLLKCTPSVLQFVLSKVFEE